MIYIQAAMPLIIKPIKAHWLKEGQHFLSHEKLYIICIVGEERKESNAAEHFGKEFLWSETLMFKGNNPNMRIILCNEERIGKNDILGEGVIELTEFYAQPNLQRIIEVDFYNQS